MKLLKRYQNIPIEAKASLWYTVCNFFQKGISFIVIPVYVRLLTTGEYGEWTVFQSWRDILIILASLNLYAGIFTKALVDNTADRDRYTSSMQGLGTATTAFFIAVYAVFRGWLSRLIKIDPYIWPLLLLYFIVYPAFSFWSVRQRVENKYQSMVVVTAAVSVLTPIISLLLLYRTDLRARALMLGYLIVQCTVGLVFYVYQFKKGKCFYDRQYWKYAFKYNIPLIPHYLSLIVLGQSDRIMIEYFCGKSDAGIYAFAYQIATIMNVLLAAINGARVPWAYKQLRGKVYGSLRAISNALCILMGVVTIIAASFAPDIVRLLGTEEYFRAVNVIPVVALGVYFTYCYDMFCTVEFYYGATGYVMLASVLGALSNIILNALLIPVFGFIAAAYTTLVSYLFFMVIHYFFMRRVMKMEHIREEIYDLRFIVVFSAILSVVVFLFIEVYSSAVLRYLFIVVVLIIVLVHKDRLISPLKTMKE